MSEHQEESLGYLSDLLQTGLQVPNVPPTQGSLNPYPNIPQNYAENYNDETNTNTNQEENILVYKVPIPQKQCQINYEPQESVQEVPFSLGYNIDDFSVPIAKVKDICTTTNNNSSGISQLSTNINNIYDSEFSTDNNYSPEIEQEENVFSSVFHKEILKNSDVNENIIHQDDDQTPQLQNEGILQNYNENLQGIDSQHLIIQDDIGQYGSNYQQQQLNLQQQQFEQQIIQKYLDQQEEEEQQEEQWEEYEEEKKQNRQLFSNDYENQYIDGYQYEEIQDDYEENNQEKNQSNTENLLKNSKKIKKNNKELKRVYPKKRTGLSKKKHNRISGTFEKLLQKIPAALGQSKRKNQQIWPSRNLKNKEYLPKLVEYPSDTPEKIQEKKELKQKLLEITQNQESYDKLITPNDKRGSCKKCFLKHKKTINIYNKNEDNYIWHFERSLVRFIEILKKEVITEKDFDNKSKPEGGFRGKPDFIDDAGVVPCRHCGKDQGVYHNVQELKDNGIDWEDWIKEYNLEQQIMENEE